MRVSKIFTALTGSFNLPGWLYNNTLSVDNSGNLFDLNDQVKLELNTGNFNFSLANADGSDMRFYKGSTLLPYWIQSWGVSSAVVWIKISGIGAGSVGEITMFYGNVSATSQSSFTNTMRRFSISESGATQVVRFNDGSGSTAANIGSGGGALSLVGGYTWNATDIWGESTGSLSLNGTSGYAEKTGLLDNWGTEGSIHLSFVFNALAHDSTLISKVNRLSSGGSDEGDYIHIYIRSADQKTIFRFYNGATKVSILGTTVFVPGTKYTISLTWNTKVSPSVGAWLIYTINGVREIQTYQIASVPPTGSDCPFRIGAMSNSTTGAAETFAAIKINDFAVQTRQEYYAKLQAFHEWRNYYQKDEESKWTIGRIEEGGAAQPNAITAEPSLIYDNGKFILFYNKITTGQINWRKETTSLAPGVTTTWTNDTQIMGGGVGGSISANVCRAIIRKFGSTWYLYFQDQNGPGPVQCATSADGLTFSNMAPVLPIQVSGFGNTGFFNCDVIFDPSDNLYKMLVDAPDATYGYAMGLATCSTPTGTFTLSGSNPKSSLRYGVGNVGAPSMNWVNDVINVWYLGQPTNAVLASELFRSSSSDFDTWTHAYTKSIVIRERFPEYDQSSDCTVCEANGESYILYNGFDNGFQGGFIGYLNIGKFGGSLSQLVTDLTITVQ